MNEVSVVIVGYHSEADLPGCMESIRAQVEEIIVVDNSPQQAVLPKGVRYLPQSRNLGFASAANIGAKNSKGKFLLFLNPDTVIQLGAVKEGVEYLLENPSVGIAGLSLRDKEGVPEILSFGKEPALWHLMTRKLLPAVYPTYPLAVDWVSGGALLISRENFEKINGFDEDFFLYWEDVDLCRRVRDIGLQIVLLPMAKVTHRRGGSLDNRKQKAQLYDLSADRYYQKHYPFLICQLQHFLRRFYRYFNPMSL